MSLGTPRACAAGVPSRGGLNGLRRKKAAALGNDCPVRALVAAMPVNRTSAHEPHAMIRTP
jgi:hypothetical protein